MEPAATERLERVIEAVRRRFEERYGDDLSNLAVQSGEATNRGAPRIAGTVVVPKQARELRRALREALDDASPVELAVAVLDQLPSHDPRVDGRVVEHPGALTVPVWTRRQGGKLATEWLVGDDPARVLVEAEPRRLVQLADGTVGWIEIDAVWLRSVDTGDRGGFELRRLADGALVQANAAQRRALFAAARAAAESDIRYRLGGVDPTRGLDCSAFVQRLLDEHTGALLPRHTGDQLRVGRRVGRGDIASGDLVFVRARRKRWQHVGLVLDGGDGDTGDERPVAHACRLEGRVLIEPLAQFLSRYRYLRTQRVLAPTPPSRSAPEDAP